MATTTAVYIPSDYTAERLATGHIRERMSAQFTHGSVVVQFGEISNGVVPVYLVAEPVEFSVRDIFDAPCLVGRAWIVDGSQTLMVDYEFESNPVSFLSQHGAL